MSIDPVSEQLRDFVVRKFPLARSRNIGNDTALLEGGIVDSLGVLGLVSFIEETFRVPVSDDDLLPEHFQSIESLTAFVRKKRDGLPAGPR